MNNKQIYAIIIILVIAVHGIFLSALFILDQPPKIERTSDQPKRMSVQIVSASEMANANSQDKDANSQDRNANSQDTKVAEFTLDQDRSSLHETNENINAIKGITTDNNINADQVYNDKPSANQAHFAEQLKSIESINQTPLPTNKQSAVLSHSSDPQAVIINKQHQTNQLANDNKRANKQAQKNNNSGFDKLKKGTADVNTNDKQINTDQPIEEYQGDDYPTLANNVQIGKDPKQKITKDDLITAKDLKKDKQVIDKKDLITAQELEKDNITTKINNKKSSIKPTDLITAQDLENDKQKDKINKNKTKIKPTDLITAQELEKDKQKKTDNKDDKQQAKNPRLYDLYKKQNRYHAIIGDKSDNNTGKGLPVLPKDVVYIAQKQALQHLLTPIETTIPQGADSRQNYHVTIELYIDEQGQVLSKPPPHVSRKQSSGNKFVDKDALQVAKKLRFKPFYKDSKARVAVVEVPIVYKAK